MIPVGCRARAIDHRRHPTEGAVVREAHRRRRDRRVRVRRLLQFVVGKVRVIGVLQLRIGHLLDPADGGLVHIRREAGIGASLLRHPPLHVALPGRSVPVRVDQGVQASARAPVLLDHASQRIPDACLPAHAVIRKCRPAAHAVLPPGRVQEPVLRLLGGSVRIRRLGRPIERVVVQRHGVRIGIRRRPNPPVPVVRERRRRAADRARHGRQLLVGVVAVGRRLVLRVRDRLDLAARSVGIRRTLPSRIDHRQRLVIAVPCPRLQQVVAGAILLVHR